MESYVKKYDDFWKRIVENDDGSLNKEQVMKELFDYSMVINNCRSAYCLLTEDNISKPHTDFSHVEKLFNERFMSKTMIKHDLLMIIEDVNFNNIDELKEVLRDYFELKEIK